MSDEDPLCYQTTLEGIAPAMLRGFFAGWPDPPSPATHLRILQGSTHCVLALEAGRVIGYITALSDGVSCAYIPHLEVLAEYRGRGIGSELVRRLLAEVGEIYMIDLMCDADVQPFYERLGFRRASGVMRRNYHNQAGLPAPLQ